LSIGSWGFAPYDVEKGYDDDELMVKELSFCFVGLTTIAIASNYAFRRKQRRYFFFSFLIGLTT